MFNVFVAGCNLVVAVVCLAANNPVLGGLNFVLFLINAYAAYDQRG